MVIMRLMSLYKSHIWYFPILESINHGHLVTFGGQGFQIGLQKNVLRAARKWKSGQDFCTIR